MAKIDLTRRTKIVATIGPATEDPQQIEKLIQAGATTFRLNFSHCDHNEHAQRISTIREVSKKVGAHIGILQDLQGPKIRLGRFKEGPITLRKGDSFTLTSEKVECNNEIANVNDGSCEPIVLGCTDSEATNYNPNANTALVNLLISKSIGRNNGINN